MDESFCRGDNFASRPQVAAKLTDVAGHSIEADGYSAQIAATGAGLRAVRWRGRLLTETWDIEPGVKPPLSCGLVLSPWPNRTGDGRYTFDGTSYELPITEAGRNNANHGFVRMVDWNVLDQTSTSVTLGVAVGQHPGWPFDLQLTATYAVGPDGLTVTHTTTNTGTIRAPYALGQHTFVRVGDVPADNCSLQLAAAKYQPLDAERQLPDGDPVDVAGTEFDFRTPRPVEGVWLDTPFTAMADDDGIITHRLIGSDGTTELWTDLNFSWVQAFTADPGHDQPYPGRGRAVAIEPMTAPPNALATGTDLIVLEPGQIWTGRWGLRFRE
ncbi:aldose 1-epimerase family protein [Williamsia muralis]